MLRNTVLAGITALALGLSGIALAVPLSASADQPDFICEDLDSGKINTVGDPSTVTVYAPPGYLIDGYCVKAATIKVFVPVVPPAATVVVDHPNVNSVSHYSLSYVQIVEEPDVATATLEFVAATCDAAQAPKLPGSSISNATWGSDTDASPLGYNIVATANPGAEFADGDGVSEDNLTKTFTGTLDDVLDDPSCDEVVPDLATATLEFVAASCDAAQAPKLPGSSISNATWGSDTDASPLGYNIVATANPGAEFADGDGVSEDNLTKTFTGTLDDVLDDPSCDEVVPDLATASLAFTSASCFAAEFPNTFVSSISNATWGSDTDADPLAYSIVATANVNALFAAGPGVSDDRTKKTFTGTLDPIFDQEAPPCVLGLVLPVVSFAQATCAADGSYTLGVANGYDPTHVTFTVNGTPGVLAGTYKVLTPQVVTVTVQAVAPNGLELEWVDPAPFEFTAAAACGELTTLSLPNTGATVPYLGWTVAGSALFLGFALLLVRRRRVTEGE